MSPGREALAALLLAAFVASGDRYEVQNIFLPNHPSPEGMIRIFATAAELRQAGYTLRLDAPGMPPVFIGRDGKVLEVGRSRLGRGPYENLASTAGSPAEA